MKEEDNNRQRKAAVITYPLKSGLYVNLTNRCPCACEFCLRKKGPGVYGTDSLWLEREPTVDEVNASIDAHDMTVFEEVVFCGYGEPTERLEVLLSVAGHVRTVAPHCKIRINTNGLSDLINGEPTAWKLKGLVDVVSISLNASDAAEYVRICHPKFGVKSYRAMLDFAADCRTVVPEVVLTIVDSPVTTREDQAKCRAIADELGARLRIRPYD